MSNQIPAIELYEAPEVEPVSVDDVKQYLRVDGDAENNSIGLMISASRSLAEKYMRVSIISQKWKLSFDDICEQKIDLPYGPVTEIDSVKTIDSEGTETEVDEANYYLTSGNLSIYFREIPSGQRVEIIYSAGFGDEAEDIPALIKQGMLSHIAYMYERKLPPEQVNESAKNLYNIYRSIKI